MEEMISKVISFILFFVNAIKDMVATLSGKGTTTDPQPEETTAPIEEG